MMFAMFLLAQLHGAMLQASALPIPISPLPWFGIALIVALLVIVVAAAIYMIAPLLGSQAMKQWSIFQMYEAVLSIALIIVFLGLASLMFTNPQQGFAGAGLVPAGCTSANTIYTLSACDLAQFNTASYNVAGTIWAFSVVSAVIPDSSFALQPFPREGDGVEIRFKIPNLFSAWNGQIIKFILEAVLLALLLSQLELILLSSALLLMSLFFTIGLIARVFGISRSFGGAMIAFGIGLGIIYPLLICITYGYIDVAAGTYSINQALYCFQSGLISSAACAVSSTANSFAASFNYMLTGPFSAMTSLASSVGNVVVTPGLTLITSPVQTLAGAIVFVFQEIGYIIAGLTLIPIINIIIVDVFIIDFSRAVGEQMSFMMLFQGLI